MCTIMGKTFIYNFNFIKFYFIQMIIFISHVNRLIFVQTSVENDSIDMDKIVKYLGEKVTESQYTESIGRRFEDILPLILVENVHYDSKQDAEFLIRHRRKSIALAKLATFSPHARRFTLTYFAKMPSPFVGDLSTSISRGKMAKTTAKNIDEPSKLDILKCCYTFLKLDKIFFMRQWKWSELIEKYGDIEKQSDEYKFIYNNIRAILTGLSHNQLHQLNENIPDDVQINFAHSSTAEVIEQTNESFDNTDFIKWDLKNEMFVNIEGVLLPVFDAKNASISNDNSRIVMVESARSNLRSIAIGVAAGKAVCLSGSVGSGKTTLIEYLAYRSGRIPTKHSNTGHNETNESAGASTKNTPRSSKRKAKDMEKVETVVERRSSQNGFLRIQLGDQTDSKMLLGQYHCTDVPGEFVWQPGVLTQAVMNGYWLLLEDLDQCSVDVCVMLTNFFENNYLSVPGFRDCIQISSGFQLFVTRRYA